MIAALSNGGGYANLFQQKAESGFLSAVLAELWDFDTRVSSSVDDYLDSKLGKPIRGYYQNSKFHPAAYFHCTLNDSSWQNYYNNPIPSEIPPLPPGPYNDTLTTDFKLGENPSSPGFSSFAHHLIRDFTFLDAAKNNNVSDVPSPPPDWPSGGDFDDKYALVPISLDPASDPENSNVPKYTQGTGPHSGDYYLLSDDDGIPPDGGVAAGPPLTFESRPLHFTALLYELQTKGTDGLPSGTPTKDVPNWFGVAVPDNISDFRNVIIYFHPNPTQAGGQYNPGDYANKSGKGTPGHTNWKELFGDVEGLGKQLSGAVKYSTDINDLRNQIVIFPFMRDYDNVGIFPQYWTFIVNAILDDLFANKAIFSTPP